MAETAAESAAKGFGEVISHWLPLSCSVIGSSPRCRISIRWMVSAPSERIFGGASAAGLPSLAFSCRFDHHKTAANPASKTPAANILPHFITSTPLPPYANAGRQYQQWNRQHARIERQRHLASRHGQAPVFRFFGTNRDQILIRRQPVHHVQKQVAIASQAQVSVRYPTGRSHHYEPSAAAFLAGVVRTCGSQHKRPFLIR